MRRFPRTYEIQDSRSASCSAAAVMKIIGDPRTWPQWQSEIISTEGPVPLSQGDKVEGRATLLGFTVDGRSSTVTATGSLFVEDVIVGVRMRVEYELREGAGKTTITRRLTASLPGGFSGRALSFLLKRRLKAMQRGVLEALVAQAEGA